MMLRIHSELVEVMEKDKHCTNLLCIDTYVAHIYTQWI